MKTNYHIRKPSITSMEQRHYRSRHNSLSHSAKAPFTRYRPTTSTKQLIPMYVNVTGPGDYDIPGFTNKFAYETNSNKRTAP